MKKASFGLWRRRNKCGTGGKAYLSSNGMGSALVGVVLVCRLHFQILYGARVSLLTHAA